MPTYEELDIAQTPLGELLLRRRRLPGPTDVEVYEVKLDGALLMSSLVNESELALADIAIPQVGDGPFDVLVGGLGLGYTAWAALGDDRVRGVTVIELLPEVIGWHERGLGPLGRQLASDGRCRLMQGDFFVLATDPSVADLLHPAEGYGAILVDIDHAPDAVLHRSHAAFYAEPALRALATRLAPGGVFALWSTGGANAAFVDVLRAVFPEVRTHAIEFFNPLDDRDEVNTIYVARRHRTRRAPAASAPGTGGLRRDG
jgi:spermidine synthase